MMFLMVLFAGGPLHPTTQLHNFNLLWLPLVSALCFWHAFQGHRPLLGRSEIHTSIFLGGLSLMVAVAHTFLGVKYQHKASSFLTATLFFIASVFYLREGLREKRSSAVQDYS